MDEKTRLFRQTFRQEAAEILAEIEMAERVPPAFELWLKNETEAMMAKGYEEMANEDRVFAETAINAQREILT